jgi:YgiT-type zinc finger domain-containing protein
MTCLICRQAEIVEGFTAIHFERGEMRLLVNHVPARVCPHCGEAYVDEEMASQLLRIARKMSEAGSLEEEMEYGDFV